MGLPQECGGGGGAVGLPQECGGGVGQWVRT